MHPARKTDDGSSDSFEFEDPYILSGESDRQYVFWADRIADLIERRDPDEPVVIKGGISPSGVPHLGNMNEVLRGYFVAEVLRERGYRVEQVFTLDDRDPLRKLPRTLADLDGNLVGLGDVDAAALGKNLGKPYTDIPDPFGCCSSYGDHFSKLIERSASLLEVPLQLISVTKLYETGEFDDTIRTILENESSARAIIGQYQDKVDAEYVPFNPICENCGKITETVNQVDLADASLSYTCTDLEAGDGSIDGCGHEGKASIRDGKLPWRFEWPAEWAILGVDFEPFGKDHAEGSWPSGQDIARNLLGIEPPVPMVYEWFTLNGEPFSSSSGHVIMVDEILELIEPAVLKYFFAKDPRKARNFDVERIDRLVAEFDRIERLYFDRATADDEREGDEKFANRVYPFLVESTDTPPIRIPYTFAAILGMTDDPTLQQEIAEREGHLPPAGAESAEMIEQALDRVEKARRWARRVENEYNYELIRSEIPRVEIDERTARALDELADFIETTDDPDEIQAAIFEIARNHDIEVGDFFATGYRLFFGQETGPQLGPFLARLDRHFVVGRLRRER